MEDSHFLNIDLDLKSSDDLSPVIEEFGDRVVIFNNDKAQDIHSISLELAGEIGQPDYLMDCYFKLLSSLSESNKTLLTSCIEIVFDIGIQSGKTPNSLQSKLSKRSLDIISKFNAEVVFTVYGSNIE